MYMDTDNRFSYRGSGSIPPCLNNWMRDVCMTIYPIRQTDVDNFRKVQLAKHASTANYDPETKTGGNYRKHHEITPEH